MNKKILIPLAAVCLLAGACAKNNATSTGKFAQEYIQLWMDAYHPDVNPTSDGLYILSEEAGTGAAWTGEAPYAYVDVTIRSLDGTISSTTSEKLAQQLGTYVQSNYYGPKYQVVGEGYSYAGVDALLQGMRIGGTRTAVIPSLMLTTSRYDNQQGYINACSSNTHLIYEIKLAGQSLDPAKDEITALQTYIHTNYGDIESVTYDDETEADDSFWFISDVSSFKEEDKLSGTASIKVNYTGRLLKTGTIFDTTLEKTAKDAGIYSSSRTYEPQSVTLNEDYSEITMGESSSLINGFKGALSLMKWKGQKAVAIFTSKHGYSYSGSGNAIPGYATLIFELEIVNE